MPRKTATAATPQTTAQMLGSLLKSARDIMRKDKGLNGDLDRLPLLTWIMFLKFLDDLEQQREQEVELAGEKFRPAVEPPYRWRDWAARPDGVSGPELLHFINDEMITRPDGSQGPGLFAYLRNLTNANGDNRREVIATVFRGVDNRMKSGYLLRDIINLVAGIHFKSHEELHTLGALYESMLREMRDAAGDSGEFYTPRPVVRFMVAAVDPRLGEVVLDPAAGTGGFLVEAFRHLKPQVRTVADHATLQKRSVYGCEAKALPYLLCQMNLLLHELDAPQIDPNNALRHKLTEIGEKDRVDVILTNPPFGGEEEKKGIQENFPEDKRTAETALLFLQLIMRKLRRQSRPGLPPARAAVVVPNGTLFGDGVCARFKEELLKQFNLHTIVRLPNGVFAPYTSIPTNILFFDGSGPTETVWYYEQPLPEGRKNYTKTQPLQFEEFEPCLEWWHRRDEETSQAWRWDFRQDYEKVVAQAQPFWDEAERQRQQAMTFNQNARELLTTIQVWSESTKPDAGQRKQQAIARRDGLLVQARDAERKAKEAQAAGDAIYWPLYNLDRKNPRAKDDITHLPPEELAASILQKERWIAEIMENIRGLLAKGDL